MLCAYIHLVIKETKDLQNMRQNFLLYILAPFGKYIYTDTQSYLLYPIFLYIETTNSSSFIIIYIIFLSRTLILTWLYTIPYISIHTPTHACMHI